MKVLELIKELKKVDGNIQIRFAFVNSEDSDGNMNSYTIHDVEVIDKRINSAGICFCLITTNEECVENVQ